MTKRELGQQLVLGGTVTALGTWATYGLAMGPATGSIRLCGRGVDACWDLGYNPVALVYALVFGLVLGGIAIAIDTGRRRIREWSAEDARFAVVADWEPTNTSGVRDPVSRGSAERSSSRPRSGG